MKIELKNLKVNLTFSEETTMFKADIYVNDQKVAYAENKGRGGSTFYHRYSKELEPLLKQAEAYCEALPPYVFSDGFTVEMDLEQFIDNLVDEHIAKKDKEKFQKRLQKDMLSGLCVEVENGYSIINWGKHTIADLLNNPKGKEVLLKKIEQIQLEGRKILNTNLPVGITA